MKEQIVILGSGESGTGAALLAKAKGYDVFVSDKGIIKAEYKSELENNNIDYEEGEHDFQKILGAKLIVKSPGIPDKVEIVQEALSKNIPVISEIEFASRYTKAKSIAITGSNGKTTTTLLTYHILKEAGYKVGLAGNIGYSFARQVIKDEFEYYVLEVSSFQLDGIVHFKPNVSVILNITPDHLDRYEYNFLKYVDSKFNIIKNASQEDLFIAFIGSPIIEDEIKKRNIPAKILEVSFRYENSSAHLKQDTIDITFQKEGLKKQFTLNADSVTLKGQHNLINVSAAVLSALSVGIGENEIRKALLSFKNAPHRMEEVTEVNGVLFVNDSKATNVDSVWYALESIKTPIVLIAGGVDKGNDYSQIESLVKQKVKALVCMGVDNSKLFQVFQGSVPVIVDTNNIKDAITQSFSLAEKGDTVLLSPACASFDLFKNYEDRGEQFKKIVKELKNKHVD